MPDEKTELDTTARVEDFIRLDLRAGIMVRAEVFTEARKPACKLWMDFGPLGIKCSSARITRLYSPDDPVGCTYSGCLTNFAPFQVATFLSEVLVLGVPIPETDEVVLPVPDGDVPLGAKTARFPMCFLFVDTNGSNISFSL